MTDIKMSGLTSACRLAARISRGDLPAHTLSVLLLLMNVVMRSTKLFAPSRYWTGSSWSNNVLPQSFPDSLKYYEIPLQQAYHRLSEHWKWHYDSLERDIMTPVSDASNWGSPEYPRSSLATPCFLWSAAGIASSLALFGRPLTALLAIMLLETKGLAEIGWGGHVAHQLQQHGNHHQCQIDS
jgi:hypothetical protein